MAMGQGPVELRLGLGSMGEPRIETKVGTEVYHQVSGCQVLPKAPACPGGTNQPTKDDGQRPQPEESMGQAPKSMAMKTVSSFPDPYQLAPTAVRLRGYFTFRR